MERIEKLEALASTALSELSQINFTGLSTIPAGRATEAVYVILQEVKQMKADKLAEESNSARDDNDREG